MSIGSGAPNTSLLASTDTTTAITFKFLSGGALLVVLAAAFVVIVSGCFVTITHSTFFTFWTQGQEMDSNLDPKFHQGEPMVIDSEQGDTEEDGLAFPHILNEDGRHSVQHINM